MEAFQLIYKEVLYKCMDGFYFKSNLRLFSLHNDYEILSCTIQTDST
jgi:hypothetical protein